MTEDYAVGYGKPPKSTQFKPGKSGNPKGRPKGAKSLKAELSDALQEFISVKVGGKKKTMTKQKALVQLLLQKSLNGDLKSIQALTALLIKLQVSESSPDTEIASSSTDDEIISEFLKKSLGKISQESANHD